jgi:hypothetical protein
MLISTKGAGPPIRATIESAINIRVFINAFLIDVLYRRA